MDAPPTGQRVLAPQGQAQRLERELVRAMADAKHSRAGVGTRAVRNAAEHLV